MDTEKIIFPAKFEPSSSPVYVRNEMEIGATKEKIWYWLTNAASWHEWYFNASKVRMINQQGNHLLPGTKFFWKTFGVHLHSEVREFIPYQRMAWDAKAIGVLAYHAWLIIPMDKGCRVITEETQHGFLCIMGKLLMPKRMFNYHQIWLEGLKKKAEAENE